MLIRVDSCSDVPLFEQIAASIRGAVANGELAVGERLPPVRELGASLGVNMHTVRAAYAVLRDEGLIEMRRGRSVTVLAGAEAQATVVQLATAFVRGARRLGFADKAILELLRTQL
jgi:DNA-binding transcriptional regulator YhcF (GntR family)